MTTPIPEGSVIITPTEVYREMQATHQATQAVAAKLDSMSTILSAYQADQAKRMDDIDGPNGVLKDHEGQLRRIADGTAPVIVELNREIGSLRRDQQGTSRTAWIGVGIALAASVALPIVIPLMTAKH